MPVGKLLGCNVVGALLGNFVGRADVGTLRGNSVDCVDVGTLLGNSVSRAVVGSDFVIELFFSELGDNVRTMTVSTEKNKNPNDLGPFLIKSKVYIILYIYI